MKYADSARCSLQPHEGPSETTTATATTAEKGGFNPTRVRLKHYGENQLDYLNTLQPHEGPSETAGVVPDRRRR